MKEFLKQSKDNGPVTSHTDQIMHLSKKKEINNISCPVCTFHVKIKPFSLLQKSTKAFFFLFKKGDLYLLDKTTVILGLLLIVLLNGFVKIIVERQIKKIQ